MICGWQAPVLRGEICAGLCLASKRASSCRNRTGASGACCGAQGAAAGSSLSVSHIVPLVGLESSVCTQSQQSALELGLEPSCRPCPHSCPQYCLGLLELIELQHLEHSRPMPGPRYHLRVFYFLFEFISSREITRLQFSEALSVRRKPRSQVHWATLQDTISLGL